MNLEDILNQLKSERSRLNQAISALEGLVSARFDVGVVPRRAGLRTVRGNAR